MPDVGRRETFAERASGKIPTENASDLDAAMLLAAARSVRRGAWWRAVGGWVSLPSPPGLFRGGEIREGAVDRARGRTGPLSPSGMEIDAMRAMKMSAAVVVGSLSAAGAASAQTAVEWKVSDGGNGHWYACSRSSSGLSWTAAKQQAEQRGGYLATPLTTEENQFIFQLIPSGA